MKIIPTKSTSNLIEYVGRVEVSEVDNTERKRVMFSSGQHCRPQTAAQEFRELREQHGRQGEMRVVHGRYVQDEDQEPTHIKVGKNWRRVKAGEVATHTRIEPAVPFEKSSEGYHYIIAFAAESVNRDDPEQCRKAFEAVEAMWAQDYSGTQATLTAHGDAKGSKEAQALGEDGKFHVHIAANAVVHSEMEINGRVYQPGQRMAGAATRVETFRKRWDAFLETRGHEFGLEPQDREKLPPVDSEEYQNKPRRTNQDYWENERGGISDHDRARRGLEAAFEKLAQDPAAMSKLNAAERMERLADEAAATGDLELKIRTQKDGQKKIRSFVVPDRKQPVGSTKLGGRYDNAGIQKQLELIALGQWKPYERVRSGPVKPITELDDEQLEQLQQSVDALAAKEAQEQQLDAWLKDWADEEGKTIEGLLDSKDMSGSPADRTHLAQWKADWEAKQQAAVQQPAVEPVPATEQTTVEPQINELMSDMERRAAEVVSQPAEHEPVQEPVEHDAQPTTPPAVQSVEPEAVQQEPSAGAAVEPAAVTVPQEPSNAEQALGKRKQRDVGRLNPRQMQDRELIATVQKERVEGGAYVSFELAAHDPVAAGREGLFLHAKTTERTNANGDVRRQVNTWQQLTKSEYAKLQLVADESSTEVNGRKVFGVRGDIAPWRKSGNGYEGYEAATDSLAESRRPGIDQDVLAKQQRSEIEARKANVLKKIDDRADEIGPTAQERAYSKAEAQEQSKSLGGHEL